MFFRICNLENCLNHKRIKQWPTRKKQKQIESNACDALRRWVKRLESGLRLFSRQLWIKALTFSSLLHPEASVCHGMCMAWRLLKPWLRDCFTARPALFLRSPLANYPNCMRDKNFPQSVRISKAQSTTFRQCFKWHIVQKVVFVESIFALWSGNK